MSYTGPPFDNMTELVDAYIKTAQFPQIPAEYYGDFIECANLELTRRRDFRDKSKSDKIQSDGVDIIVNALSKKLDSFADYVKELMRRDTPPEQSTLARAQAAASAGTAIQRPGHLAHFKKYPPSEMLFTIDEDEEIVF